jgi:hypothetical protein
LVSANDGLHLLQTHVHAHSATQGKPLKPIPETARTPQWALPKKQPKFGPDGSWATPYCKSLLGCEPYCPWGCDGLAKWEANYGGPGLGNADQDNYDANNKDAHFTSCVQGDARGIAPFPGYKVGKNGGFVKCLGSENATKKPFWPSTWSNEEKELRQIAYTGRPHAGLVGDGTGWGNEFCPKGCVNDCAEFKLGSFITCGMNLGYGWSGYNGGSTNAVGPNNHCPQNVVFGTGHTAYTWCGDPKETCKLSADIKARLKAAKAAKKAAKQAFKKAFGEAKNALAAAEADALAECEG